MTELPRQRLASHALAGTTLPTALDVVRRLGALQAQDRTATLWSLGLRSGLTLDEVEAAVARREVVRTWPMRGTLHWVPGEDARWMCRLLSAPAARAARRVREHAGITEEVASAGRALVEGALADGPLSRPALYARLDEGGWATDRQRGYHLIVDLAQQGVVVQAGTEGKQPTFALLDEWVPTSRVLDDEEGLATVVERYVRGHGPVGEKDVAGWWGGTLKQVRQAVADLGDRVVPEDGRLRHRDAEPSAPAGTRHLLPGFDEYLLGHKDRSEVLDPDHLQRIVPGANGVFTGTVLVDGVVAGTWKRAGDEVEVSPFGPLPDLSDAVAAYSRFVGRTVTLRTGPGPKPLGGSTPRS